MTDPDDGDSVALDVPTGARWAWSADEERFEGDYTTRDEAAALGPEEYDDPSRWGPGDTMGWTGRLVSPPVERWAARAAVGMVEQVDESAYDEVGAMADGWLGGGVDRDRLAEMLADAFTGWLEKTGREPEFFSVEDVQPGAVRDE